MNRIYIIFLDILKQALQGIPAGGYDELSSEYWKEILSLAKTHNILPLVYNAVYSYSNIPDSALLRRQVRQLAMLQTMKTAEFIQVYNRLRHAGCTPLVVKGLVCRRLYPQPDLRLSTDEDLLIPAHQFEACRKIFAEFSLNTDVPAERFAEEYEIPFRKKDGALYIELHKSLFPPQSDAYGDWNSFFADAFENATESDGILTLSHTDHMFYLICHAFKHFIHSGFGIRQVCDIVMYANAYGAQIDWDKVYTNCTEINAQTFAATLFEIGERYLVFDKQKACYPQYFCEKAVDETNMLADLLSAGVFGGSTMSRKHSSNMTLEAVTADKQGKKATKSLKGTLFPSAEKLQGRYPYLQKKPYLLPKAWASRGLTYLIETKTTKDNSSLQAVKLGRSRVDLLKEYKVIK